MDNIKIRERGLFKDYHPDSTHRDVIYFSTDTKEILLNGNAYGASKSIQTINLKPDLEEGNYIPNDNKDIDIITELQQGELVIINKQDNDDLEKYNPWLIAIVSAPLTVLTETSPDRLDSLIKLMFLEILSRAWSLDTSNNEYPEVYSEEPLSGCITLREDDSINKYSFHVSIRGINNYNFLKPLTTSYNSEEERHEVNLSIAGDLTTDLSGNLLTESNLVYENENLIYRVNGSNRSVIPSIDLNKVTGVKGSSEINYRTGNINITPTNIGLGNVNNTSDINKPVSTALASAIADAKKSGTDAQKNLTNHINNTQNPHLVTKALIGLGNVTNESKATMFSNPNFTGIPTAPTAGPTTNSTLLATTSFVQSAIENKLAANDAMLFKGTIGTGGTVTTLPNSHNTGWTYKVITAGTYAGNKCEVGDLIICISDGTTANNAHWTVVQTNIDGAVTGPANSTDNHVAIFSGTSGKVIKNSGFTIGKSVPSNAVFTDTTYSNATVSAAGLMSSTDKSKLDSIAAGGEVNQNAFSTVKVGTTNVLADTKTDTLELAAGSNITLTPDAANDKITITGKDWNSDITSKINSSFTALSRTGDYNNGVTMTIGGTTKRATIVPDGDWGFLSFEKDDNSGKPVLLLLADITNNLSAPTDRPRVGFIGTLYKRRPSGNSNPDGVVNLQAVASYDDANISLATSNTTVLPVIIGYQNKKYLALVLFGSLYVGTLVGYFDRVYKSSMTKILSPVFSTTCPEFEGLTYIKKPTTFFSFNASNSYKLNGHPVEYFAPAANYVKKSGDTMTGYLTTPKIFLSNNLHSIFADNKLISIRIDDKDVVVTEPTVFRKSTQSATVDLGASDDNKRWNHIYGKEGNFTGTVSSNRVELGDATAYMYNSNGNISFSSGGGVPFLVGPTFLRSSSALGNTVNLGTEDTRWKTVFSLKGNFSGQIESSVGTGTAPFVVKSKTLNTNLNADMLDGKHLSDFGLAPVVTLTRNRSDISYDWTSIAVSEMYSNTDSIIQQLLNSFAKGACTVKIVLNLTNEIEIFDFSSPHVMNSSGYIIPTYFDTILKNNIQYRLSLAINLSSLLGLFILKARYVPEDIITIPVEVLPSGDIKNDMIANQSLVLFIKNLGTVHNINNGKIIKDSVMAISGTTAGEVDYYEYPVLKVRQLSTGSLPGKVHYLIYFDGFMVEVTNYQPNNNIIISSTSNWKTIN